MFLSTARGAAVLVVALAALSVSCGADPAPPSRVAGASASASAQPSDQRSASPGGESSATGAATDGAAVAPEEVRNAFAGLQATLNDSCTPGECAYFLGRVDKELARLDRAMKSDPKGPGHFPEPIALIAKLDAELGDDRTFENLKKHEKSLIGTRDKINVWMQGHPDDYR
ncbi:hypothetical protein [Streptomyces antarcticus]|uniref:hypothetical protein n=1 Tax=Streptomyces antarcticus TaxID=2996458 RepID=UPI002271C049|nr:MULTISPECIES: hypothetical protein [unclassified Streptomyces]MCY0946582.1 hypothetical protein [Streptomyces sp. H34-AA3]MCZ4086750.1 hypothetical protein [Streptomyces sp. H34-S5]